MNGKDAGQLVRNALQAAVDGDAATAADILARLCADGDRARMYGVCSAAASVAGVALKTLFGDGTPNPDRGERWHTTQLGHALKDLHAGQGDVLARKFSLRFITAHCNEDDTSQKGLFDIAREIGGDYFVRCVCQLFADVAGLCTLASGLEARG